MDFHGFGWPEQRHLVFGTGIRRFESCRPSQRISLATKEPGKCVAPAKAGAQTKAPVMVSVARALRPGAAAAAPPPNDSADWSTRTDSCSQRAACSETDRSPY